MGEASILAAIPHGGELVLVDSDLFPCQLPRRRYGALMLMSVGVHDLMFWGAVVLCSVAQLFILKAVFFPAPLPVNGPAADGRAAGRLRPASRPLEMAWVVLPAVGLALVFWWAWDTQHPQGAGSRNAATQRAAIVNADASRRAAASTPEIISRQWVVGNGEARS